MDFNIHPDVCKKCFCFMSPHPTNHLFKKCVGCGFCELIPRKNMKQENYISMTEFLMGRDKDYPLTDDLIANANTTVPRVNLLLERFFKDHPDAPRRHVTSGYRPGTFNSNTKNAAKKSNHMICKACDLWDGDGLLDAWCMKNLKALEEIGLWLESPGSTPNWCHLQIQKPKSGNNPFMP